MTIGCKFTYDQSISLCNHLQRHSCHPETTLRQNTGAMPSRSSRGAFSAFALYRNENGASPVLWSTHSPSKLKPTTPPQKVSLKPKCVPKALGHRAGHSPSFPGRGPTGTALHRTGWTGLARGPARPSVCPSVCPSARGLRSQSAREERGRGGRSAGGREGAPPGRGGSGRAAEASESESERGAGSRQGPGRQASGEGSRGSPCSAAPRAGELVPRPSPAAACASSAAEPHLRPRPRGSRLQRREKCGGRRRSAGAPGRRGSRPPPAPRKTPPRAQPRPRPEPRSPASAARRPRPARRRRSRTRRRLPRAARPRPPLSALRCAALDQFPEVARAPRRPDVRPH